ncbi:hypothetical protein UAW_01546 [Enterococcus haemoperoxidus ATCC BAA-382]|uniref:Lipoprotein n=1 Tax=Enterococcus haemoperoxidus ATCC BAA-382 TaxID=1158608 RepID=R2ST04_9ENTE|nr:hypothetical protein [Enterococcus haemoperoxidus]EOH98365.1 hypothetical protein UAW_01546 [Enterococcus haemoperoxidus ATCC BAA-382]EOT59878.1 hypothetical protein I583_02513 [Enterococcus haemoperoxidus ATCC BAA-382]
MNKFYLIGLMLLLVAGCSKISSNDKDLKNEESLVTLEFQGMKLLIKNDTKDIITILDSETEFSTKKNNKWALIDETQGLTVFTTNILSEEETELDLTNELSKLKEKEAKVTIHYELNSESREESIVYVK